MMIGYTTTLYSGQSGNGDNGERNNRWDMSPLPGPRQMPILPRPATAYSDFQPYSSPVPCPAASRTTNMLTVKNQSAAQQAFKAARPPTSLPLGGNNYPLSSSPPPLSGSCMHNKLSSVPSQSAGKPNSALNSEGQQEPIKNNNIHLLPTNS